MFSPQSNLRPRITRPDFLKMQKQYGWQAQEVNHIPAQPKLPSVVYDQPSIGICP
jgi:hypothetical protein